MSGTDKPFIGFFGRMNAGKSSVINALSGTDISIVSEKAGTTTDLVKKAVEIPGVGAVVLTDTAGLDDKTEIGSQRVSRALSAAEQVDAAVIVFETQELGQEEKNLIEIFKANKTPFFLLHNKADIAPLKNKFEYDTLDFSAKTPDVPALAAMIKKHLPAKSADNIFEGIVKKGDTVLLVMPQDASAPHGRLILPQVQAIRALIDLGAYALCTDVAGTAEIIKKTPFIDLVVTDSQAFAEVSKAVPQDMPLSSFSILLSRLKGDFKTQLEGTEKIDSLKDGDKVLILESCSHVVNHCDDIGRVKIPALLKKYTGKNLSFVFVTGLGELPGDLSSYALAVQCGGCMVTKTQLLNRIKKLTASGVPVTNYGMAISYATGIFPRAVKIFKNKN